MAFAVHAQSPATAGADDEPLLWTASATGRPTLLLLPTIHELGHDDPRIDARLQRLVGRVEAVVLEAPIDEPPKVLSAMRKYAFYGNDDNITNHLRSITPEQLARCARAENKSIVQFFQLKPWLAALDIATHRPVRGTGNGGKDVQKRPRMGIDQRLFRLATNSHRPVLYLETVEEGLRVLDTLPADEQEAWLRDACNSLATGLTPDEVPVEEFEDAWIRGDIAKFENLTTVPRPGGKPEIFDANQRIFQGGTDIFAAAIARYGYFHGKGPILVAVGAGHFFGKRSLLNELEAAGYQVKAPRGGA